MQDARSTDRGAALLADPADEPMRKVPRSPAGKAAEEAGGAAPLQQPQPAACAAPSSAAGPTPANTLVRGLCAVMPPS